MSILRKWLSLLLPASYLAAPEAHAQTTPKDSKPVIIAVPAPPAPPAPPPPPVMVVPAPAPPMMPPAPPAPPAPPPKPRAYSAAEKAIGVEIATMLNTREDTLRVLEGSFKSSMRAEMAADASYASMEAEYPGIIDAMLDATMRTLLKMLDQDIPILWERLGIAYAESFDLAELTTLKAFYAGPAGQTIIRGLYTRADTAKLVRKGFENPGAPAQPDDFKQLFTPGAQIATFADLSPEARKELMALTLSPLGTKMNRLNPRLRQVAAAWGNDLQLRKRDELIAVLIDAASDYMAKPKPKTDAKTKKPTT